MKKAMRILGDVLVFALTIVAFVVLTVSITSKKSSDGTSRIFGYELRFVQSESMAECAETDVSAYKVKSIPIKSCVFVKVAPEDDAAKAEWYKTLRVGDVLTFKYVYTKQETITHRIVQIEEKEGGGFIISLEGDNKASNSSLLKQTIDTTETDSPNYIIGKVEGQSYLLGLLVYALKSPIGLVCLIIVPCCIVIAIEALRVARVLGSDKKEKHLAQENEIAELKRKLEELEKEKAETQEDIKE